MSIHSKWTVPKKVKMTRKYVCIHFFIYTQWSLCVITQFFFCNFITKSTSQQWPLTLPYYYLYPFNTGKRYLSTVYCRTCGLHLCRFLVLVQWHQTFQTSAIRVSSPRRTTLMRNSCGFVKPARCMGWRKALAISTVNKKWHS